MNAESSVVLILDDEDMVRENLQAFLEDEGFATLTSASGEKALALLADNRVDVCIVDMRLPGMSGNEFIIKAHEADPGPKYLIHTGSTNYKPPAEVLAAGLTRDMIFIKPLSDMGALTEAVRKLVGQRGER